MSDELARMLSNPLRARLLFEYHVEPRSPSKLAAQLEESVSLVSYHTGVLLGHGCLELVRTQRRRGATEHFYRCTIDLGVEDEGWARLPHSLRRALILSYLSIATDESHRAGLSGGFDGERAHFSRTLLKLDEAGLLAVSEVLRRTLDKVDEIQAACRARPSSDVEPYELVMLNFRRS